MGSGEVAIVALSTMISLKVTFSDGLGGVLLGVNFSLSNFSGCCFPVENTEKKGIRFCLEPESLCAVSHFSLCLEYQITNL